MQLIIAQAPAFLLASRKIHEIIAGTKEFLDALVTAPTPTFLAATLVHLYSMGEWLKVTEWTELATIVEQLGVVEQLGGSGAATVFATNFAYYKRMFVDDEEVLAEPPQHGTPETDAARAESGETINDAMEHAAREANDVEMKANDDDDGQQQLVDHGNRSFGKHKGKHHLSNRNCPGSVHF